MSDHYNRLKNTVKSRYREKLQTVRLTIEDDLYITERITRTLSLTTCLCGPKLSTGTYLLTLLSTQVFIHNSSFCHGNSSSPISISRMVMLALYPCGSLDKVML